MDHRENIVLEHSGYSFSTIDRDNDGNDEFNCAASFGGGGGFWYGGEDCYKFNLNYEPVQNMQYLGIGRDHGEPYLHARMSMRPHQTFNDHELEWKRNIH